MFFFGLCARATLQYLKAADTPPTSFLPYAPLAQLSPEIIMLRRSFLLSSALAGIVVALPPAFAAQDRLDPNTATAEQLAAVPDLDPALAQAILAQRPFATMVEFDALVRQSVSVDEAGALYEQLFVPINLNTGTREEIALIPGMSNRMTREFLEYRPYADLGVFDREIGKYVDDAEVARLRSYVTL